MKSLPSPPISRSLPSPPTIVSLPAPPSTISPAMLPLAEKVSSPPFMLTTRLSVVPMSIAEGGGVNAVEEDAVVDDRGEEGLGAVAAVDLDGVDAAAALVEVAAVAGVPDHAVVPCLAEGLVVAGAAGEDVVAGTAEQLVDRRPCRAECRCRPGRTEYQRRSRRSACRCHSRQRYWPMEDAPLLSSSERVSLPPRPKICTFATLATVGVPPCTLTAPPLTSSEPAVSRLTTMVLSCASPRIVKLPGREECVNSRHDPRAELLKGWSSAKIARFSRVLPTAKIFLCPLIECNA